MKQSSAEGRLVADITDVTIDVGENEETEYAWSPCLVTKEEFFFRFIQRARRRRVFCQSTFPSCSKQ
jgi:hypothetical protein